MGKKLTTEEFIADILCRETHPDGKYNYGLIDYINDGKKIEIYCNDCEKPFLQTPNNHKNGRGCPTCNDVKLTNKEIIINLTIEEEPIDVNGEIQCRCAYCKEYFIPTRNKLSGRVRSLLGKQGGECRLYCSDSCKNLCPIYYKSKHYNDIFRPNTYRPVQPELRHLTFERDNNQCQRCGSSEDLHCHHITGVEINPVESADVDNCITLCYTCHNKAHSSGQCDVRRQKCKV
jgi:hypothetical protein